jgi:sugar phosphate isomerase/epimerase
MPREDATRANIGAFLRELGRQFPGSGSLYLAGGAMLVYQGFRPRTVDIDYRVDLGEGDDTLFIRALRAAQKVVPVNVEPASPADFIPLPAGWRERCRFLAQEGGLAICAFDPVSTALAKIERGHERDIDDVLALCRAGVIGVEQIVAAFEEIAPRIETEALPRITEEDFRRKVEAFVRRAQAS